MDVMEKNWKKTLVAAVLCGSLVAACGPKIPHPPAPGSVVAFSPAQEAKASMDAAIAAVNAGRLDQVYGMLPESYRNDLADVVRAYASKIDRHLYEQGAGVLAAAGELIAAQARNLEDLLGGHAGNLAFDLPDAVDMTAVTEEQIRQAGQWIAGAAKSLSYDDFAEGNIRPLLSNPLAAGLLQKVFKVFPAFPSDAVSCTLAEDAGAPKAEGIETLRVARGVSEEGEPETEDIQFVKVEGQWVPLLMQQGWSAMVRNAMEAADYFEIDADTRRMADTLAPLLTQTLDQLKSAQSAQELQARAVGAMMTLGMMMRL